MTEDNPLSQLVIAERLARLETRLEALDGLQSDLEEIKSTLAEYKGARKALNWLTHLGVGIATALATYLTVKGK